MFRYFVAPLAVAVATLVTWALWDWVQPAAALFFAAVMLSAWYGGFGPGLLASVLAALAGEWLAGPREHPIDVSVRGGLRLGVFLFSAVLISWLNGSRRRVEQDLRDAHAELERRVAARTSELSAANRLLQSEVAERQRAEQEVLAQQERLRALATELSRAEERQLRQIAADLHDGIGQLLATARIRLELLQDHLGPPETPAGAAAAQEWGEVHGLLAEAIRQTRSLTVELSPPVLYEAGFGAAVRWLAARARERQGTDVRVTADDPLPLNDELRVFLFRAVRELLVNMGKHAHARTGHVSASTDGDEVKVVVEDDGVGFDPAAELAPHPGGHDTKQSFGLFHIRERLRHYGGRLEVDAEPGRGSRFTLVLPCRRHEGERATKVEVTTGEQ